MIDFLIAALFLLVYEAMSWPLRLAIRPLPMASDVRRLLSRVAGPPLIALPVWFAAHAGIPLGAAAAWGWWAIFAAAAWGVCRLQGATPDIRAAVVPIAPGLFKRKDLFIECFGLFVFFSFLAFRRFVPEMSTHSIDGGSAEKFANSMFFWSAYHARTLPLDDYWLTGHPQAYYYWGHFFWAWIVRAGGFPGEWGVTLALSRVVMLMWEAGYLLLRAFGARPVSAALGAFFIAWGGNPHTISMFIDFIAGGGNAPGLAGWLKNFGVFVKSNVARPAGATLGRPEIGYFSWFMTSRVIPFTVNEYPSWSAILGDFHAHHLSLPWMTAWLAIVLKGGAWFGLRVSRSRLSAPPGATRFALWIALFVTLGAIACLSNLWITPLVVIAAFAVFLWRVRPNLPTVLGRLAAITLLGVVLFAGIRLIRGTLDVPAPPTASIAAASPSAGSAIPFHRLPASVRSTYGEIWGLWGFQIVALGLFLFIWPMRRRLRLSGVAWSLLALAALAVLVQVTLVPSETGLLWVALAFGVMSLAFGRRPGLAFAPALFTAGACLLLGGLEVFFIEDSFRETENMRYNSYFKLSYPAWPVLGAGAWIGVQRLFRGGPHPLLLLKLTRPLLWSWRLGLILCALPVMGLVLIGIPARVRSAALGDVPAGARVLTLDAYQWLQWRPGYAGEHEMLAWIRANVPPREVVVEAIVPGGYAYHGRVASLAGRPIPLGWDHHEFQWRGAAAPLPVRDNTLKARSVYEAPTPERLLRAAAELDARWVVFGKSEFEHYGPERSAAILGVLRAAALRERAFPLQNPSSFVFELPPPAR